MYSYCLFSSESYLNLHGHGFNYPHKKRYCADTSKKRDENIKITCGSHLSGLERVPSDIVFGEDVSHVRAAAVLYIV